MIDTSTDFAIIVGVSHYPGMASLNGPENDAQEFYNWVIAEDGGRVKPKRVRKIVSSEWKPARSAMRAKPTAEKLRSIFDELHTIALQKGKVGRRLYLYFAGHGYDKDEIVALLMANATVERPYHFVGSPYADLCYSDHWFDEILLFMDCCRDAEYQDIPLEMPIYVSHPDQTAAKTVKRFYGYATKASLKSYERKMPEDSRWHGIFSYTLLQALKKGAIQDGKITTASLRSFVHNAMELNFSEKDRNDPTVPKRAQFFPDLAEPDHFVIVEKAGGDPEFAVNLKIPPEAQGKMLQILSGDFNSVLKLEAVFPQTNIKLVRGKYLAQILTTPFQTIIDVKGTGAVNVEFK
jgi:hypothetical protein